MKDINIPQPKYANKRAVKQKAAASGDLPKHNQHYV